MIQKRIMRKGLALSTLCMGFAFSSFAQSSYESALEKIDSKHQDCLDLGENMIACSGEYYKALDSMLNVVYKAALKDLPNTEKADLRNEQREWLSNKNIKFREIEAAAKEEGKDGDGNTDVVENKAGYVRERLDELIGKLK